MATFGETIAKYRKEALLSQKELAAKIKKEDGEAISPQYLNDLEHDRRNAPSEHLIKEFARVLNCPVELLYYCAGELQPDTKCLDVPEEKVVGAYRAFRRALGKDES